MCRVWIISWACNRYTCSGVWCITTPLALPARNKQQQDARASVQEDARNAAGCQCVHYFHSKSHTLSVLVWEPSLGLTTAIKWSVCACGVDLDLSLWWWGKQQLTLHNTQSSTRNLKSTKIYVFLPRNSINHPIDIIRTDLLKPGSTNLF